MIDEEFSAEYAADPEDKKQLRLLVNGLFNWRCKHASNIFIYKTYHNKKIQNKDANASAS